MPTPPAVALLVAAAAGAASLIQGSAALAVSRDLASRDHDEDNGEAEASKDDGGARVQGTKTRQLKRTRPVTDGNESEATNRSFLDEYPVSALAVLTEDEGEAASPRAAALPQFLDKFDWIFLRGQEPLMRVLPNYSGPMTVFYEVSERNKAAERSLPQLSADGASNRTLVLAGHGSWLSRQFGGTARNPYWVPHRGKEGWMIDDRAEVAKAVESYRRQRHLPSVQENLNKTVQKYRKHFGRILYESKDMEAPGVYTFPSGLDEAKFVGAPNEIERAQDAIRTAGLGKKTGAIAALSRYDDMIHCGSGWGEAQTMTREFVSWSASAAALQAGVDAPIETPADWWGTMMQYRFMLAPTGAAIQTAGHVEALLVLTIPIVRRGVYPVFDDLVRYGFPMVVLDDWNSITKTALDHWWKVLSPRLEHFREACLTTDAYFRLIVGQDECCGGGDYCQEKVDLGIPPANATDVPLVKEATYGLGKRAQRERLKRGRRSSE